MSEQKELDTLFVTEHKFKLAGREITIKEACLEHIPLASAIFSKGMSCLVEAKSEADILKNLTEIISKDFELVTSLIVELTDLKREEIKKLNLMAAVLIFKRILEVNIDFLSQNMGNLLEEVKALVEKYRGRKKSKG